MKTFKQFQESEIPLQLSTKNEVKKRAIEFLKQIKNLIPNPTQFQQAMKYIEDIVNGKDLQSRSIMQQVMTQPIEPTNPTSPTMPRQPVGTPPMISPGNIS